MALFLRGLCLLAGYLFSGFLTAEVVARCTAGVSARDIGTGNPGMANIATHLGKKAGLLVLAGEGAIRHGGETYPVKKGQSVFLPAGLGDYALTDRMKLLRTRV